MSGQDFFPTTVAPLLNALRNQEDSVAWRQFSARYAGVLICFCRRRGLQQADAEDISQQVMFAVSRQIRSFQQQADRGLFRSWLATIAIRAIWKQKRQLRRMSAGSLEGCEELAEPNGRSWLADFNAAVLDASLNRICPEFSAEEWAAFLRMWQSDEPCLAVAVDVCKPASWVYRTKYRILDRLKREIAGLADDSAVLSS
jgi:RNA polymerase sigma-70 factor, ECF subfamily